MILLDGSILVTSRGVEWARRCLASDVRLCISASVGAALEVDDVEILSAFGGTYMRQRPHGVYWRLLQERSNVCRISAFVSTPLQTLGGALDETMMALRAGAILLARRTEELLSLSQIGVPVTFLDSTRYSIHAERVGEALRSPALLASMSRRVRFLAAWSADEGVIVGDAGPTGSR